ncbi:MAG: hypothetical protein NC938_03035 [Candidatus Omnitrophica bacterium]|nr:hypothetical protein [Candidatus Omnitrophota bacterium]
MTQKKSLTLSKKILFAFVVVVLFFMLLDRCLKVFEKIAEKARENKENKAISAMLSPQQIAEYRAATDLVVVPYLAFRMKPNFHSHTININSFGFRGAEVSKEKPEGTFRIIIVGGSGAMGYGSSSDETAFPRVLEKLLNTESRNKKFEVINAGLASAISAQELVLIVTELIDLKPDMVVIFDGFNDIVGSVINDRRPNYPWRFEMIEKALKVSPTKLFLNKRLKNFRLTKLIMNRLEEKRKAESINKLSSNPAGVDAYLSNIRKMVRILRGLGIEPVVILQPNLYFKKDPSEDEKYILASEPPALQPIVKPMFINARERLAEMAKSDKFAFLDFMALYDPYPDTIFFDAVHVGDRGQAIIASAIFEAIKGFPFAKENLYGSKE